MTGVNAVAAAGGWRQRSNSMVRILPPAAQADAKIILENGIDSLMKTLHNYGVELDDVIIGNFNLDQDSTEIVLSGKAIKYYLKK